MTSATATRRRARGDITRLVHRDLDLAGFAVQVTAVLRRAVPGEGTCLLTLDPATLLPTGEVVHDGLPPDALPRLAEIEQREPDFNKIVALARRSSPAASLSDATEGHLEASTRQREVRRPHGFADELRVALRDDTGTWGAFTVLREQGSPHFTDAEVHFVASLSPVLAEGVRRALRTSAATAPHRAPGSPDGEPGLLVLAPDLTAELRDAGADRWLGALAADGDADLPAVVRAVAIARTPARRHRHRPGPGADDRRALAPHPRVAARRGRRCPDRHPHRAGSSR